MEGLKLNLWRHQEAALDAVCSQQATMLGMKMGTGKTLVTLAAGLRLGWKRTLVVCPKAVINVWPQEFAKHLENPPKVIPLVKGTTKQKGVFVKDCLERYPADKPLVFVVNYESAWLKDLAAALESTWWDAVVCDESQKIKSHNSKASKFLWKLGRKACRRLCLTGTPLAHSPLDAFGQYRFLDDHIYGQSHFRFRQRYAVTDSRFPSKVLKWINEEEFESKFHSILFQVGNEVLDLPEFTDTRIQVELSAKALRLYREMEQTFYTEVDDGAITAANALVKLLRLQQITSGYVSDEDGGLHEVDSSKRSALIELLDGMESCEPVVVFCLFRSDLDAVHDAARTAERGSLELSGRSGSAEQLAQWQHDSGEHPVLAVQIRSGGAGIDLTRARYCVYYSTGFSLADYLQSRARVHRPGQDRPVTYYHLVGKGTVDEKVYGALSAREDVVNRILNRQHVHN